jgi:hypothetical protein
MRGRIRRIAPRRVSRPRNQTQARHATSAFGRTPRSSQTRIYAKRERGFIVARIVPIRRRGVGHPAEWRWRRHRRCPSRRDRPRKVTNSTAEATFSPGSTPPTTLLGRTKRWSPPPRTVDLLLASSRRIQRLSSNAGRMNGAIEAHCFTRRLAFAWRWHFARSEYDSAIGHFPERS